MSDERPAGRASWWLRSQDRGTLIFSALAALVVLALLYIVIFVGNDTENTESTITGEEATTVEIVEPAATSTPVTLPTAVVEPTAVVVPTAIPTEEPTPELVTTEDLLEGADNAESVENDEPDTSGAGAEGAADTATDTGSSDSSGSSGSTSTFVPAPTATEVPTPVPTPRPRPTPCLRDSIGNCVVAFDDDVSSQTIAADATPTPGGPTPAPVVPPTGGVTSACDAALPGEALISFSVNNTSFSPVDVIVSVGGVVQYPSLNAPAGATVAGQDSLGAGFQIAGGAGQSIVLESIGDAGAVTVLATNTVPVC